MPLLPIITPRVSPGTFEIVDSNPAAGFGILATLFHPLGGVSHFTESDNVTTLPFWNIHEKRLSATE